MSFNRQPSAYALCGVRNEASLGLAYVCIYREGAEEAPERARWYYNLVTKYHMEDVRIPVRGQCYKSKYRKDVIYIGTLQ